MTCFNSIGYYYTFTKASVDFATHLTFRMTHVTSKLKMKRFFVSMERKGVIGRMYPHSPCENFPPFEMSEFPWELFTDWFMLVMTHLSFSVVVTPRALKWASASRCVSKKNTIAYLNSWCESFTVQLTRLRMITHFTTQAWSINVAYMCKVWLIKWIHYIHYILDFINKEVINIFALCVYNWVCDRKRDFCL